MITELLTLVTSMGYNLKREVEGISYILVIKFSNYMGIWLDFALYCFGFIKI